MAKGKAVKRYFSYLLSSWLVALVSCQDAPRGAGDYQKGMSLPSWSQEEYLDERVAGSIGALGRTGANYIAVIPTCYQKTTTSNEIYPTRQTASDSAIRHIIALAHSSGFKVMLKPHLDVENGGSRTEIMPTEIDEWFSAYSRFILKYAAIAQQSGVDGFCIGAELKKMSSMHNWGDIIDSVRAIYSGSITYAANWDEYPQVGFWRQLDAIGIDAYFPLAEDREATIEEYLENLRLWIGQVGSYQRRMKKKVIFTEVGFRSIKGSGVRPWDWRHAGIMDEQSQADAYRVVLQALAEEEWLEGMFVWTWPCVLTADPTGYSPYNKKAEDVLKEFWQ